MFSGKSSQQQSQRDLLVEVTVGSQGGGGTKVAATLVAALKG